MSRSIAAVILLAACAATFCAEDGGFAAFDKRASAGGERLTVVFFGCSLTWGANASDHANTSFRGVIRDMLETRYPKAPFRYYDASIGGTDSILGVHRLERDALNRKPDLVFVDFTANDGIDNGDGEKFASYEAILRRLAIAKIPTVQVAFPFQWDINRGNLKKFCRLDANRALADTYATGWGDAVTLIIDRVEKGKANVGEIWALDAIHPVDAGYKLFAEAAWEGFTKAVDAKLVPKVPEKMVYADTYMTSKRARLTDLGKLPEGWGKGRPSPNANNYDWTMSRWLDEVAVAGNSHPVLDAEGKPVKGADGKPKVEFRAPARIKLQVEASDIVIFGEDTSTSGNLRVWIDGKAVTGRGNPQIKDTDLFNANRWGGHGFFVAEVARGLDITKPHVVEIEAVLATDKEQELRMESICVAGGKATVTLLP